MKISIVTSNSIQPSTLTSVNMLHHRDIAVPKINDFIYRRRLLLYSESAQKRFIKDLSTNLDMVGQQYNLELSSLRRDCISFLGSKDDIIDRLTLECRYLPKDQDPSLSQSYSQYVDLIELKRKMVNVKSNDDFEFTTTDVVIDKLHELYTLIIDSNVPSVTDGWLKCRAFVNDKRIGPVFFASSTENVSKFEEELHLLYTEPETTSINQNMISFMKATGFIEDKPKLLDDHNKDLLHKILSDNRLSFLSGYQLSEDIMVREQLAQEVKDGIKEAEDILRNNGDNIY